MKRVLCAWLPHWPLQRWRAAHEGSENGASTLLLYESRPPRPAAVVAASAVALAAGVRPGMALTEALALSSRADGAAFPQLVPHDAEADRQALVGLAEECHRFSPAVSLEDDPRHESLLLEVGGTAARFGGESALAAEIARHFAHRGLLVRGAVADTRAAALALARYGTGAASPWILVPPRRTAEALAPLPIEALRLPEAMTATIRSLGLATIGQLERLPRAALPSRWGQPLLDRLDQAQGRVSQVAQPVAGPERWIERREWEFPLERRERLAAAAEQLLRKLTEPLRRQGLGWWQLKCALHGAHGPPRVVGLTLFRPSASARYLRELLELRWERLRLAEPVAALEIVGLRSGPLAIRQRQWLADDAGHGAIGGLIDRLVSRLGPAAVWTPRLTSEVEPERAYCGQPIGPQPQARPGGRKRSAELPAAAPIVERPLQLLARPRRLEALALYPDGPVARFTLEGRTHEVARCDGPERIETGWWRGPSVRRDYFRVETATGQRAWIYRRADDDEWFLQGWG